MNIFEQDKQYVVNTYNRFPLQITKGKGSVCYDENGKEYIDLGSGIAVNVFGFCDEEWIKAVSEQMHLFQHTSNLYYHEPCVKLAKLLCEKTGMKKVFFSNSGAEANECAIKTARKYAQDKKGKDYYNIVTLVNSFHGRTITTLSATGQDVFHKDFTPLTSGFVYALANDINSVKEAIGNNKTAAIMFEIVQGEGGVLPLDGDFVKAVYELCKKEDILLIIDEIQTGNGRCGKLYSYMNYGIEPDIVTTAKGIAGGIPMGVTFFNEKTEKVLGFGNHGSTFGANPLACVGAYSVVSRLDDKLLSEVVKKSEYIKKEFDGAKGVKSVSGLGLMLGIETEKEGKAVALECLKRGVIVLTAKNKVRLLPALNIPFDLLEKAIKIIKEVCAE